MQTCRFACAPAAGQRQPQRQQRARHGDLYLSAKIISRKAGRSSTDAAAYRACEQIEDQRTGEVHDFTRKRGLPSVDLVMPSDSTWRPTRAELWNAVEAKNKRADAQVAREFLLALPEELDAGQRRRLAMDFTRGAGRPLWDRGRRRDSRARPGGLQPQLSCAHPDYH